ncbi:VOC family protein [Cytobacillus firmus]|uniref:VOC family protein n=1 Tax=Cytobacillus firmus TaxID=1399 RepID=UPI00077C9D67|nr:VOC family protein [Cytobacillus firmus]MBG9544304.1 glyoxalase [Cytobacillus firmus]MBG9546490.1 glyoxalase [Cytobacillus firmus]MBG9554731.1 glyoxalase [Cytobacillus firmus]MBG9559018.1 glyoxalase [Cytobacillus firmus]MBG9574448.1 glyoxalase [Cytobacillus firmus]
MAVNAYLNFNGNTREAIEFYVKAFELDMPEITTFGEAPQNPEYPLPEEARNLVMHSSLNICGSNVMFSDTFPGMPFTVGNNINLAVVINDVDNLRKYFNNLQEGGKVTMELQETFWSKSFGQLTDKFGINWMFSHEG